jgi:phage terminase large subunit
VTEPADRVQLLAPYMPLFVQRPAYRYAFLTGGRGSGKSWQVAAFLLNLTYEPGHIILFTRWTMVSAHLSIIPEFSDKIGLLGLEDDFTVSALAIVNKRTGSRILFHGIKTSSGNQTARLKSIKGVTTWVLDEAEELIDPRTFDSIDFSIRAMHVPNRVIMVLNPAAKTHFLYERFVTTPRDDTLYIHTTWHDNRPNLAQSWIDQAEKLAATNPARYRHIFEGEWVSAVEGLMWTAADLARARLERAPEVERVLIGVDPAVTSKADSNETGIVVVGFAQRRAYVLEDLSGRFTPHQWATVAIDAAKRYGGSVVAETNQGGDMVHSTLKSVGDRAHGVRIIDVRATKGKLARAEPVYSLYQDGRVFHVGQLPVLEQQMLSFRPDDPASIGSPDRVDALVWAITAGLLTGSRPFVV